MTSNTTGNGPDRIFLDPEIIGPEEEREKRVRAGFWKTVRKAAGKIPFMEDVVAAYYCALDPNVPARVRGSLLAALAYFVLPLDAVPDFIIGVGFGDDLTILAAILALFKTHITDLHREAARRALKDPDERI